MVSGNRKVSFTECVGTKFDHLWLCVVYQARPPPSRKVKDGLAGCYGSIHNSQLVYSATALVIIVHTEAKVLLLSQNGTERSDWSASNAY